MYTGATGLALSLSINFPASAEEITQAPGGGTVSLLSAPISLPLPPTLTLPRGPCRSPAPLPARPQLRHHAAPPATGFSPSAPLLPLPEAGKRPQLFPPAPCTPRRRGSPARPRTALGRIGPSPEGAAQARQDTAPAPASGNGRRGSDRPYRAGRSWGRCPGAGSRPAEGRELHRPRPPAGLAPAAPRIREPTRLNSEREAAAIPHRIPFWGALPGTCSPVARGVCHGALLRHPQNGCQGLLDPHRLRGLQSKAGGSTFRLPPSAASAVLRGLQLSIYCALQGRGSNHAKL